MSLRMRSSRRDRGFVMVIVILVILVLSIMGIATVFLAGTGGELSTSSRLQDQALRTSEAGVEYGIQYVQNQPDPMALINSGYATVGYGGSAVDANILDNGATVPITGPGGGASTLRAAIKIDQSVDAQGQAVKCGLVGYSDQFGQVRFRVTSRGYGPGLTTSEIEAHVFLPPQQGFCPPSTRVAGGYAGS